MKNKAPLALMELTVMILIFSLAAALCLQAFVWSDTVSRESAERDQAVLLAENAAEVTKHCRGDFESAGELLGGSIGENVLTIYFDGQWQVQEVLSGEGYVLTVKKEKSAQPLLGQAMVEIKDEAGDILFSLPVAWQEVDSYE